MDSGRAIHTSKRGARWVNTRSGSRKVIGRYDSKGEAVSAGRQQAHDERTEHVSFHADGSIDEITRSG